MRLPEQPGDGKPENETKGDQESPEVGEEPPRSSAPDFPTWQVFPDSQIPEPSLLCNSQCHENHDVINPWAATSAAAMLMSRVHRI
ncbi:Calcium-binding protein 8 [Lemmus lemmus]